MFQKAFGKDAGAFRGSTLESESRLNVMLQDIFRAARHIRNSFGTVLGVLCSKPVLSRPRLEVFRKAIRKKKKKNVRTSRDDNGGSRVGVVGFMSGIHDFPPNTSF